MVARLSRLGSTMLSPVAATTTGLLLVMLAAPAAPAQPRLGYYTQVATIKLTPNILYLLIYFY